MRERKLESADFSDKPLSLSQEAREKVIKKLKDAYSHFGILQNIFEGKLGDKSSEGMKNAALSLIESKFVDLCKMLDYDGYLKKEMEKRYQKVRALNQENRELRKQLGEKVSAEDVREKLKNFSNLLDDWWTKEGTGYIHDKSYLPYCALMKLSGSVSPIGDDYKERLSRIKEYGFHLAGRNDKEIIDNDHNRALLSKLISATFPTAKIRQIFSWNHDGVLTVKDIEILITNYEEIGALTLKEYKEPTHE